MILELVALGRLDGAGGLMVDVMGGSLLSRSSNLIRRERLLRITQE
jgi:hypothetical protein